MQGFKKAIGYRKLKNGAIQILVPTGKAKREPNVSMGFYDQYGFHPIRASRDYDGSRVGERYSTGYKPDGSGSKKYSERYQKAGMDTRNLERKLKASSARKRKLAATNRRKKSDAALDAFYKTQKKFKGTTKKAKKKVAKKRRKNSGSVDKTSWRVVSGAAGRYYIVDGTGKKRSPIGFKSKASGEKVLRVMRGMGRK